MYRIILVIFFVVFYFTGCEVQDVNRPGDKLDGYIFFTDTSLSRNGGFHSVSVYSADSTSPFLRIPLRTDSLRDFDRVDSHYVSQFSMDGIPPGKFYVASTWTRLPRNPAEVPIVLGTYGCDTSRSCTNHEIIVYPNTQGNFRNITSWTDTTKRLN